MTTETVLIMMLVGVMLFLFIGMQLTMLREKKRTEAFRNFAEQRNFSYSHRDFGWPGLPSLEGLSLFSLGRYGQTVNVMTQRTEQYNVFIFDYTYKIGYGKRGSSSTQTVILFEAPGLDLPSFRLIPKTILHWIGKLLDRHEFDREMSPAFSRHYVLREEHNPDIRHLFNQRVRAFYDQHPGLTTEASEHLLLVYRAGKRLSLREMSDFIEEGFAVFNLFYEK